MIHNTDIAIIGAGPVGLFAIFEAGMLKMKCTVIDALEFVGGQCSALYPEKPIYDIPAHPTIDAAILIEKLSEQAAPFHPNYLLNQKVIQLHKLPNGSFELKTDKGNMIISKAVIIAAGCGAFGPNRPPLENLEEFEKTNSVQYMVRKSSDIKDKNVVIAGGGDSAVDWAIILADIAKSITVVHRRPKFRCAPENSDKLAELAKQGKIKLAIPYQLHKLNGQSGHLNSIDIIDLDGNIQNIEADILLPFFGLAMELGPILEWNLDIHKHHILVDQRTLRTNIEGIYAIGDVAHYPGKLKLILNGFAEAAMACHDIYNIVYPDTALHFEYSTTKGIKTS